MFLRGVAVGTVFLPMQTGIYTNVSQAHLSRATSVFNTQRQAAPAFGIAITTTVLAMSEPVGGLGPESGGLGLGAFRWAFLAAALLFVPAILFSLRVRADDAAATRA